MLQLNTDWTSSSHIDWLSGATAGSLLVLHLELYSGQFVRMNCRRLVSSTAPTEWSREAFVHDGSMNWFLINQSVNSCKPDEPELIKHVQVSPTP